MENLFKKLEYPKKNVYSFKVMWLTKRNITDE